ncbi:unnamed protein product, partial [Mesorhabditis belari]|uniref:ShKT domain-containing protein n=1 Tax=Mesorhabditis belari TaxID=2138241 RepID=A0AAF3EKL4_9BILA
MGQLKNKPCDKAPLGSPAVLKLICQQLHQMDEENRQESLDSNLAPPEFPALHDCMNITCVCSELNSESIKGSECLYKGKRMEKLIRKEYRMMSDEERERFHSALNTMKKNGKFDEIAAIHAGFGNMGGAHSGPAFLPWHREYLKRLEFELRRVHPEVYLPYWDSTLDGHLPRPEDSAIFTTELFGTSIGPVLDGPFANWKTMRGKPLLRQVGKRQDAQPFMEDMVTFFLQQPANRFLAFSASRQECPEATEFNSFEFLHALVHKWIGGDMFDPMTSGNDPVFFMHHSFVDLIWENWRTWRQDRTLREIEYPLDDGRCMSAKHFLKAPMIPFSSESGRATTNADGLSNLYTDELYEYAPQPTCRSVKEGCGSRFLFCDTSVGKPRCVAKIRLGGSCGRLAPGQDVCYNGRCVDGFCEWAEDLQTSTDDIEVSESEETSTKELEDKITKEPMIESTTVEGLEATNQTHSDNSENETSTELFTTELTEGNVTETAEKLKLKVKTDGASSTTATPTTTTTTTSPTSTATTASSTTTTSTTTTTTTTSTASTTTTPASTRWSLNWEPVATTDFTTTTTSTTEKKLEDFVWTTRAPMVTFTHMVATDTAPCFNFNECCQEWALQGQCSSNRNYMDEQCGASCNACIPSTPIVDDCSDRHEKCGFWARARECYSNPYWMAENCRQSCGHCEKTRAQVCSRKSQQIASSSSDWVTSTQKPRDHECYNADCSDKYSCCSHWVKKGECQTNFKFMMCNCRSACGMCGSMTDWKDNAVGVEPENQAEVEQDRDKGVDRIRGGRAIEGLLAWINTKNVLVGLKEGIVVRILGWRRIAQRVVSLVSGNRTTFVDRHLTFRDELRSRPEKKKFSDCWCIEIAVD